MADRKRPAVLFIGPTPPPYQGVAVTTDCLLHSSLAENFRLLHLDISDRRAMNNSERLDLKNIYLALAHGLKFCRLLIGERPEIVYVPVAQSSLGFLRDTLFMIPARWFGAKLVIHLHGGAFDRFYAGASFLMRGLIRYCLRRVDLAVVLSEKFRHIFGALVPPERVTVVENGIVDEFPGATGQAPSSQGRKLRVLFLSILVESKGFVDVLRAIPDVLREVDNVEFVFVGDGSGYPEFEKARAWVEEQGLQSQVKFLGPKWGEEKRRLFAESDVFVFPTWYPYEGQPRVILEAMAAGLPVVTTRHAAIESTLGEEGAVYVPPRDPKNLAAGLVGALTDPELRAALGSHSRRRFLEYYTVDSFAGNLGAAFSQVLGRPAANSRRLEGSRVST